MPLFERSNIQCACMWNLDVWNLHLEPGNFSESNLCVEPLNLMPFRVEHFRPRNLYPEPQCGPLTETFNFQWNLYVEPLSGTIEPPLNLWAVMCGSMLCKFYVAA